MPLDQWLPCRYLASFTWPVPAARVEHRGDGITYYNASRAVDQPFIATLSTDGQWVVASFARQTGNVWSNPQLTCQHVDPQASLLPRQEAVLEVKLLILRGSLDDALQRAVRQRRSLKQAAPSRPYRAVLCSLLSLAAARRQQSVEAEGTFVTNQPGRADWHLHRRRPTGDVFRGVPG
jgi:hypothetical protein